MTNLTKNVFHPASLAVLDGCEHCQRQKLNEIISLSKIVLAKLAKTVKQNDHKYRPGGFIFFGK